MSLRLSVNGDRWRDHLRSVVEATPGIVPVAKGNGYGFTLARLARRTAWLGVDVLAVGTYAELPEVASRFDGDLLVLTPWRPYEADLDAALASRVIHTVGRPADLADLVTRQPGVRVVLERRTSMRRHGFTAAELWDAAPLARRRARIEGVALHLPMSDDNLAEATALMDDVIGAEIGTVWVSHLTTRELATLRGRFPDITVRPRIGTALWLGDAGALDVTALVQDVHPIERGESYGYRQRTAIRSGHLLVVSGGTAHGIGLTAPTGAPGLRSRAATLARGGMDAAGLVRSPFSLDGRQLLFAEPPHMQASMLFLPAGSRVPAIGERLSVRVRHTITSYDEIVVS